MLGERTVLRLETLREKTGCLTEATARHLAEACVILMDSQAHQSGVALDFVFGELSQRVTVSWEIEIDDTMRRGNRDENKRTDNAACALALMLISDFTEFYGYEQSATGDRIDYYLRSRKPDDTLIFNETRRLEISGIAEEKPSNSLRKRLGEKISRLDAKGGPGSSSGTTYICVVEFSQPKSELVLA